MEYKLYSLQSSIPGYAKVMTINYLGCRRISEVDHSYGEQYQFRSQVPFLSYEDLLQSSRLLFSDAVPFIGVYSRRHHTEEAAVGYRSLCLQGFVVQGSLDHKNPILEDVYRIIDSIGWSYSVMHVHPFRLRVVREFIPNKPFNDEGALIRGCVFRFTPSLINQLMMIPSVEHSFEWRNVDLSQAITHLTRGQCSGWTALYRVCELNWLPCPDFDAMLKNRLRLLYAVANRHKIDFGHLVYDQVIEMCHKTEWETNLVFPNLIYQLLMLQKEIPLLPGDKEPIGRGLPIFGLTDIGIYIHDETKLPFTLCRRQFPIRLCYAMTINKSQGQSSKEVILYLPNPVFYHGQLYVALSRVTSKAGSTIIKGEDSHQLKVKNIVYK
uniref:ATP-dependent DNA helicase n=1 Tax=Brassica oleracea var. oleracea TaxID=109376 RepID=A0A0D3DNQ0_BRAOL